MSASPSTKECPVELEDLEKNFLNITNDTSHPNSQLSHRTRRKVSRDEERDRKLRENFTLQGSVFWPSLGPLLRFGRYTGFFYLDFTEPSKEQCPEVIRKIYSGVVFGIIVAGLLRTFTLFDFTGGSEGLGTKTVMKSLFLGWMFLSATGDLYLLLVQRKLVHHLQYTFLLDSKRLPRTKWLRTISLVFLAQLIGFAVCNPIILSLAYFRVVWVPFVPNMLPWDEAFPLSIIVFVYTDMANLYCLTIYAMLALVLRVQVRGLKEEIVGELNNRNPNFTRLSEFRSTFERIYDSVQEMDHIFRSLVTIQFGVILPMVCLLLYTLFKAVDVDTTAIVIFVLWTGYMVSHLMVISVPALLLLEESHTLLSPLFKFSNRITYADWNYHGEFQLLALQFATEKIELTASGFFVLNRATLLTIGSAIATYFALIMQFDLGNIGTLAFDKCIELINSVNKTKI